MKMTLNVTALFVTILLMSCGGTDDKSTAKTSDVATAAKPVETAMEVSAADLAKAYEDNEVNADNLYKGKSVTITGKIDDIGKDITDEAYITFKGPEEFSVTSVQCMIDDKAVVATLKKGQQVTVTGKVSGKMMNVIVNDCSVKP